MTHKILSAMVIVGALAIGANASIGIPRSTEEVRPIVRVTEELPSRYDLRDEGRVTPIRSQNPWGTCWAFAAVAALESSYLTNFRARPEDVDFSEMCLIWYSRINRNETYSFSMYNRGKARLIHMGDYGTALQEGSYPTSAIAVLTRLSGPDDEGDFPYLSSGRFAEYGFSISDPPTHKEAEQAGLIPLEWIIRH